MVVVVVVVVLILLESWAEVRIKTDALSVANAFFVVAI